MLTLMTNNLLLNLYNPTPKTNSLKDFFETDRGADQVTSHSK